jgi:hypothetical protein
MYLQDLRVRNDNESISKVLLSCTIMASLTCRFDPQQMSVWSNRTGVHLFTDEQRNEAYIRAHSFVLEQRRILLEAGWKQSHRNHSTEVY